MNGHNCELNEEIRNPSNEPEVSEYIWNIAKIPEVWQELSNLSHNGEDDISKKDNNNFETSFKHNFDVAGIAEEFADCHGCSQRDKRVFITAALLHDIGKVEVDPKILTSKEKISEHDWKKISQHPGEGWKICQRIAANLDDPEMKKEMSNIIAEIVLRHHFYVETGGYPPVEYLHIKEEPDEERLVKDLAEKISMFDVFDAIVSKRSYNQSIDKNMEEVRDILNSKFPDQVDVTEFLVNNFK